MAEKKWSKAPLLAKWAGEGEGNGRAYTDPTTGKDYPSVTTILKNTPKADMMGWAAMKVAEKARDRPDIVLGDPDDVVKRLQYAHNDFRDERAWVGSGVHATIQAEFEGTWDYYELDAEQMNMLAQWEKFCRVYQARILASERTVLGGNYMGTLDAFLAWTDPLDGEEHVSLIDLKTSRKLWDEHKMQLAALARGEAIFRQVDSDTEGATEFKKKIDGRIIKTYWLKESMPEFDSVAIVHLRDDFWDFELVEDLDSWYDEFACYARIWEIQQERRNR